MEGVPKIPAPTIRPTMMAVASPSDRTWAGPECSREFSEEGIRVTLRAKARRFSQAQEARRVRIALLERGETPLERQAEKARRRPRPGPQRRPGDAPRAAAERERDQIVFFLREQQRRLPPEA